MRTWVIIAVFGAILLMQAVLGADVGCIGDEFCYINSVTDSSSSSGNSDNTSLSHSVSVTMSTSEGCSCPLYFKHKPSSSYSLYSSSYPASYTNSIAKIASGDTTNPIWITGSGTYTKAIYCGGMHGSLYIQAGRGSTYASKTITCADALEPSVNISTGLNNSVSYGSSISFYCVANDNTALRNINLWTNKTGTWAQYSTQAYTGLTYSANKTWTISLPSGTFNIACLAKDTRSPTNDVYTGNITLTIRRADFNTTLWNEPNNKNLSGRAATGGNTWIILAANQTGEGMDYTVFYVNNTAVLNTTVKNASYNHTVAGSGVWQWDVMSCLSANCSWSVNGNWTFFRQVPSIPVDFEGRLDIISNVTFAGLIANSGLLNFTNLNYTANGNTSVWWIKKVPSTEAWFCELFTNYYVNVHGITFDINIPGGCEALHPPNANAWLTKPLPETFPQNATYYLTITGIYGPDRQNAENTKVQVIRNNTAIKSWTFTDAWNSTNQNSIAIATSGFPPFYNYSYANCTIPENTTLQPSDVINISQPNDPYYLLAITLTHTKPANTPECGNVEMKCLPFTELNPSNVIGTTCNVTTTLAQRAYCTMYTGYTQDCVYGNENGTGTPEPQCYPYNSNTTNAKGTIIKCKPYGNWCPENFNYDTELNKCTPAQELCDYGDSGNTLHGCENMLGQNHPGFYNNKTLCLYDFLEPAENPPPWPEACCEFLRVPRPGLPDYVFFARKEAKIY